MSLAVEIKSLSKHFRIGFGNVAISALENLTLDINEGEVFGLLGSNGAGKSTTIKILLGIIKASGGQFKIFGKDLCKETKRQMGYLPETASFYGFLTAYEILIFYAQLCGLSSSKAKSEAVKVLDLVGLDNDANREISQYSKGMMQRVGIAQAIIHNPRLVILDEPASGLDPIGARDMADTILRLKSEGKTIILSSHLMSEVEKLCDRIAILSKGTLVANGTLDELLKKDNMLNLEIKCASEEKDKLVNAISTAGFEINKIDSARENLSEYFEKKVK